MWKSEEQVYTLCLSRDEITYKAIHLIPGIWDHGHRIIVQIIDDNPMLVNGKRQTYEKWFYDGGGDENIPQMSLWLFALGTGEVRGSTAEYLINKIFNHILNTFEDVKQEFVKHFPKTAKQMGENNG